MEKPEKKVREAGEVFLFMHRIFRASRNLRAHWYIDHLGKEIGIEKVPESIDETDEYSGEMVVVGIIPADGDGTELVGDEKFIVTTSTKCTYISRYYRIVFVLDMSPSIVVADDESNCCLVDRLMPSLRNALRSSVKPFVIPGTSTVFKPQVFTSVSVFTPFRKFEEDLTLCQGVLVTDVNVDMLVASMEPKFVELFKKLFTHSRPILEQWGRLKRRHKHMKFDSQCENESNSEEKKKKHGTSDQEGAAASDEKKEEHGGSEDEDYEENNTMKIPRGVWEATERHDNKTQLPFASDKSYVMPEWSLIYMLRKGMYHIQMLPENTQSNLVIISDSVSGMPKEKPLQGVLDQLRMYTVAFSFIQLQKRACAEPVFGHVGSSSLFQFMTMATFGTYLPRCQPPPKQEPIMLWRNAAGQLQIKRAADHDPLIDESPDNINTFHRALICWSFQNALRDNEYLLDTFRQINSDFLELQQSHVDRHRKFQANYQTTLNRMMYVRLREGFALKSIVFVKNSTQVILTLRLAFRPLIYIDYIITSKWPVLKGVHQWVNVELVLEAPYNELKDLLTDSTFVDPTRMNIIKTVLDGIIDADRLLLHIHSFDTTSAYFTIPPGVTVDDPLFQHDDAYRQYYPQLCIVRPDTHKTRGFVNFWRKMLEVDDRNWQKWVHTQTERGILNMMSLPFEMFTNNRILDFDCRYPLNGVLHAVKVRATFCLVDKQTYVTLIYPGNDESQKPLYFFIRKVINNGPFFTVKTAFLGGVSSADRRLAVEALRQRLINTTFGAGLVGKNLEFEAKMYEYEPNADKYYLNPQKLKDKEHLPACTVFRRPLERLIIKYTHVPIDLTAIVRAEENPEDHDERVLITLHNSIAKVLCPRRSIIVLSTFEAGGGYIIRLLADFCQNVLMNKRVQQERFRPSWVYNNAVSLLRQVHDRSGPSLEQFIMFPATAVQPDILGRPILRRKAEKGDGEPDGTNVMPSKTNVETLMIISEMWTEPSGSDQDDQLRNLSSERRLHEDLRFVSIIFTLDKILRLSGSSPENGQQEKPTRPVIINPDDRNLFPYVDRARCTDIYELTGIPKPDPNATRRRPRISNKRIEQIKIDAVKKKEAERNMNGAPHVPKEPIPGNMPIRFLPKLPQMEEDLLEELDEPYVNSPYEKYKDPMYKGPYFKEDTDPVPTISDIHADAVSTFVTVYSNIFNLTNLVFHAQRKYLPMPNFVTGADAQDTPRCNALQLNALHCQLAEITDLTWAVDPTENDIVFADLCKTLPEAERPPATPMRVYVKALTARMVSMFFVPAIQGFDVQSRIIPMFLLTIHESQIAHCYALEGFDEHGIVSVPMGQVLERWDSGARFGWTPNNRNVFPEKCVTFQSFIDHFQHEILPRIRMRAMYEAAMENIEFDENALIEMTEEVPCLESNMPAIPQSLRNVCQHFGEFSRTPPKEEICCRGSNIEHMFRKMLRKNFRLVKGVTHIYFLDPDSIVRNKEKRMRRNRRSRGNSGMMYVSAESLNTENSESDQSEISAEESEEDEGSSDTSDESSSSEEDSSDSSSCHSSLSSTADFGYCDSETLKPMPPPPKPQEQSRSRADSGPVNLIPGEQYSEYAGKYQPMFITFNCSVKFKGFMDSFAINFLPTCIHQVLSLCRDQPSDEQSVRRVELELELIVITTHRLRPTAQIAIITQRLSKMSKTRLRNPYEFERQRRESYRQENEADVEERENDEEREQRRIIRYKGDALYELPTTEGRVARDLVKNLGVILELEKILSFSRAETVDERLLETVKNYIDEACKASGRIGHAESRTKPFLLIDGSQSKIERFMNAMKNRSSGYLKLERLEGTNMYYCRSIADVEMYKRMKEDGELRRKPKERRKEEDGEDEEREKEEKEEENEEEEDDQGGSPDEFSDFWIIITLDSDAQQITAHFCQRFAHQHSVMIDQLWSGIRNELRVINQESLLEMTFEYREVDDLLIPKYIPISQFDETDLPSPPDSVSPTQVQPSGSPTKMARRGKAPVERKPGELGEEFYYYFCEGYFQCPLLNEIWITVPERLRAISKKMYRNNPLKLAFERLKGVLTEYSILNRNNDYIYKDDERNQIFYFQLHMDRNAYQIAVKGTKAKLRKKQLEDVEKNLETKICLTVFGIKPVHPNIIKTIWESLLEKMDSVLFSEIMRGYLQNQDMPLSASELAFLQPDKPDSQIRTFFSIPSIFHEFLPSLLFYIGQHIEAITNVSSVKVKENEIFFNGTAFMKTPIVSVPKKKSPKRRELLTVDGIDVGVEATENSNGFFSMEEPPAEPEEEKLPNYFRSYEPFLGEIPPDYSLSSFFVYHVLPTSGVTNTGLALIEFRIVQPDGRLIARFDQPSMNEDSHQLLVPNVLDDKATVYRDIIKSQQFETPKYPVEKSFCGYVEMIVWLKGDVVAEHIEKMMREIVEMSMMDVVTEFGYLNTPIVEEGVLTVHVAVDNRNSEVFDAEPHHHINKNPSASSVTASVDTRHQIGPTHSGEIRKSLAHGGSMDIGLNPSISRGIVSRMSSVAKDIESNLGRDDSLRRQDFINRKNAYSLIKWLDYVASKQGETNGVVKEQIRFEFQHASLPALFEIRNRLEVSLGGLTDSEIRERVYLCGLRKPTDCSNESHAGASLRESCLSIVGTCQHDGRFEVLTTDPFHAMTEDCGVDESQSQEEYIIVSCIKNVFSGFGENTIRCQNQVSDMKQMFRNHLHGKYDPLVQTHMYSPRQRIMMAHLKGDFMTVYFYNYHQGIHKDAVTCAMKVVGFHNSKSRLLREIGLHKMGITHLSPFHTEPIHEYDYEPLIWTDPAELISKEFPGEQKPPPAYMREPQCSNIFFRLYRQPDLQETMGRSKIHFKSDCVKTMHYEQMLRWRSGLKTKIDFIQKITKSHMEMIKGNNSIDEFELIHFVRPPKVARKLGPPPTNTSSSSSVRHRHTQSIDEDHMTEDGGSMTERTSKRASIYGESLKSQPIPESEIFKGKGEFLKKTVLKLDLAATKFHEIRTPFFLRADWNTNAPRRSGEMFDEVIRECDIHLLLEEPLKELQDRIEVQKAKANKQLMKRKYSEKNVEVTISDVTVRNVEGVRDAESPTKDLEEEVWSDDDSDVDEETRGDGWEAVSNEDCGGSSRSNSESKTILTIGEENYQRMFGKVRRSWKPNPPGSPAPLESRHNSQSSSIPVARPSESGPIEKMINFTWKAASNLSRKLTRKQSDKQEAPIEDGEEVTPDPSVSPSISPLPPVEPFNEVVPIVPIMYRHAEEFSRYFQRKYGFRQFVVEKMNRHSKALNRYTTTSTLFRDLPFLVFFKAYDGGVIFACLKYEIPEFVVTFHMYERAKLSSADYYMIDQMEALYKKESAELHLAADQLKLQDSVCFMTFNFDYHLRAVATYLDAMVRQHDCIFGRSMNVFYLVERMLDYYQHELILTKNLVAMKYQLITKKESDELVDRAKKERKTVHLTFDCDPMSDKRYAGTPIVNAVCIAYEDHLYKTDTPVTVIEMTGVLGESLPGKMTSRVVPSIKLQVHLDDVGDGELWPSEESRKFIENYEGKQRRRLTENISKYGTENTPTPWEDGCVRRTVREVLQKQQKRDN